MSEDFEKDFIVLTDEEGVEQEFEHLATIDYKDETYMAFCPYDENADEDSTEVVILKVEEDENGEDVLVTVDDDDLLEEIFGKFLEMEEEEDEGEDDEDDEEEDEDK